MLTQSNNSYSLNRITEYISLNKLMKFINPQRGTRNTERGTRNTEHGTRNAEQPTANIQQSIDMIVFQSFKVNLFNIDKLFVLSHF